MDSYTYNGDFLNGRAHGFGKKVRLSYTPMPRTCGTIVLYCTYVSKICSRFSLKDVSLSRYVYEGFQEYEGEFKEGEIDGKGIMTWADGTYMEGSWINGAAFGYGKRYYADGSYFEGIFRNDIEIEGIKTSSEGNIAEIHQEHSAIGTLLQYKLDSCVKDEVVVNRSQNGFGTQVYDNCIIQGEMENNKFNGRVLTTSLKGNILYNGYMKDSKLNGNGMVLNENGNIIYIGSYKNNLENGFGVLFNEDMSIHYIGEWVEGVKQGIGALFTNTGKLKIIGRFFKNECYGTCLYFNEITSLPSLFGVFINNKISGYCIHYNEEGRIQTQDFIHEQAESNEVIQLPFDLSSTSLEYHAKRNNNNSDYSSGVLFSSCSPYLNSILITIDSFKSSLFTLLRIQQTLQTIYTSLRGDSMVFNQLDHNCSFLSQHSFINIEEISRYMPVFA
ncbi:hypothetical protein WA158_005290 [Blastocystis sp. Blastoise]